MKIEKTSQNFLSVKIMKYQNSSKVGDSKSPVSRKSSVDLRDETDLSARASATLSSPVMPISLAGSVMSSISAEVDRMPPPSTCLQKLWFSFFFDGTGNNLDADIVLKKHSNIARLYRAHKLSDVVAGIHAIYIPGIGTYFPEIGDPGATVRGAAFGAMGEARLDFALGEFDRLMKAPRARAASPLNAITEINVAVFGFSRGAALARAFVNLMMEKRCKIERGAWKLEGGGWPVRFRFMGLFDTVASVGQPMSRNNTDYYNPAISDVRGMLKEREDDYGDTRPALLAFSHQGVAGADPAPGPHAGHESWGSKLHIHESVEEVRHFVAAHEIRNSFPLDSISNLKNGKILKPAHFYETIYPGAHSDVGGGYAMGEGGKSPLLEDSLSLIPLRHMYEFAVKGGVPMYPESRLLNSDFCASPSLVETYNCYLRAVGVVTSIGDGFNRHMKLYLAYKFREMKNRVRNIGQVHESIKKHDERYRSTKASYELQLAELERKLILAQVSLAATDELYQQSNSSAQAVKEAREVVARRKHEYLRLKAEHDAVPDMTRIHSLSDLYSQQLLADVQSVRSLIHSDKSGKLGRNLRPHYRGLLESYENEILEKNKLIEEAVILFFERYVHDSLAGFGRDATFPSDPRVIYLGADEKYRFASSDAADDVTMVG